jgi:hypothetical protein
MFGWWKIFEADSIEREARTKTGGFVLLSDHMRFHHEAPRGGGRNSTLRCVTGGKDFTGISGRA